jgi:hypothetical protein
VKGYLIWALKKEAGIPAEEEEIDYNKLDRERGFSIQGCQY